MMDSLNILELESNLNFLQIINWFEGDHVKYYNSS